MYMRKYLSSFLLNIINNIDYPILYLNDLKITNCINSTQVKILGDILLENVICHSNSKKYIISSKKRILYIYVGVFDLESINVINVQGFYYGIYIYGNITFINITTESKLIYYCL